MQLIETVTIRVLVEFECSAVSLDFLLIIMFIWLPTVLQSSDDFQGVKITRTQENKSISE